jgi:hypothetical protein
MLHPSPILSTIEPGMVIIFSAHNSISFEHMLFWYMILGVTPNHIPPKYRWRKKVTKLGMSTIVEFILDKDDIHDEGYVCLIGGQGR